MKSLSGVAVVAAWSALAAGGAAHAQEAVQWRVEDGGNGHWYQVIGGVASWNIADNMAAEAGGHLATVTTPAENEFAWGVTSATACFAFLGGYQDLKARDYTEPSGGWRWVTGETFGWTNWFPGEPNDVLGNEHALAWRYYECTPTWNDVVPDPQGDYPTYALVEWSADCNGDGIVDYGQILDGTFADMNANGVPDTCECLADVNQDGVVNGADISAVLGFWGQAGKPLPAADITRDGLVDGADIAVLLGSWGPCQ